MPTKYKAEAQEMFFKSNWIGQIVLRLRFSHVRREKFYIEAMSLIEIPQLTTQNVRRGIIFNAFPSLVFMVFNNCERLQPITIYSTF